jgi:hypothetical protein
MRSGSSEPLGSPYSDVLTSGNSTRKTLPPNHAPLELGGGKHARQFESRAREAKTSQTEFGFIVGTAATGCPPPNQHGTDEGARRPAKAGKYLGSDMICGIGPIYVKKLCGPSLAGPALMI